MENTIQTRLDEVKTWLQGEFSGIRTGQAAPSLLDSVKVESYGSMMPLNQIASVGIEDARTLRISPWDSSQISAIEKALQDADLGISVASDSAGVRAIFPELTVERRGQLQKLAKSKLEDARIRVRSVRDEAMKSIEKQEKAGEISKDELFTKKEDIQGKIDGMNRSLEALYEQKESELQA